MQRRRELMGMQSDLPMIYRKVDYIQTTGTQCLDTNYTPVDGDDMQFDFSLDTYPASGSFSCLVATPNADPQIQFIFGYKQNLPVLFYKYFSSGEASRLFGDYNTGEIYRAVVSNTGVLTIGNNSVTPGTNDKYVNGPFKFFVRSTGGIEYYGKLYNFIVHHSGVLTFNLIPCVRKSDNKPGMYDTVSKTFYTNAGTGEFIVPA